MEKEKTKRRSMEKEIETTEIERNLGGCEPVASRRNFDWGLADVRAIVGIRLLGVTELYS